MFRVRRVLLTVALVVSIALIDAPAIATNPSGDQMTSGQIIANGIVRQYQLYVPASYNRRGSVHGLALVFHGLYNDNTSLVPFVVPAAGAAGIVVAFPEGLGKSWNAGSCCGFARAAGIDDVGFAAQLIASLSTRFHPRSVVTAGYSNGAMLSWLIGCRRTSVVTGIVDASGTQGVAEPACRPGRSLIVTAVHGRADRTIPYNGGGTTMGQAEEYAGPFRAITGVIAEWGKDHDRCRRGVLEAHRGWSTERWSSCAGGVTATLFTVNHMAHDVPDHRTGNPVDFGSLIAQTAAR